MSVLSIFDIGSLSGLVVYTFCCSIIGCCCLVGYISIVVASSIQLLDFQTDPPSVQLGVLNYFPCHHSTGPLYDQSY